MKITVQLPDTEWQVTAASTDTVTLRMRKEVLIFTAPANMPEGETVEVILSHGGYVGSLFHCSVKIAHPLVGNLAGFMVSLTDIQQRVVLGLLGRLGVAA